MIHRRDSPIDSIEPPPPYVRVVVPQAFTDLGEGTWHIRADGTGAYASYYPAGGGRLSGTGGTVSVSVVDANRSIEGTVDVHFPSGGVFPATRRVHGRFAATWVPRICID